MLFSNLRTWHSYCASRFSAGRRRTGCQHSRLSRMPAAGWRGRQGVSRLQRSTWGRLSQGCRKGVSASASAWRLVGLCGRVALHGGAEAGPQGHPGWSKDGGSKQALRQLDRRRFQQHAMSYIICTGTTDTPTFVAMIDMRRQGPWVALLGLRQTDYRMDSVARSLQNYTNLNGDWGWARRLHSLAR